MEFQSLAVGDRLPSLVKGPMSTMHVMRWSAAIENWHRIHYDYPFATEHDGLPNVIVNGSWKQHVLAQLVTEWAGTDASLLSLEYKYSGLDLVGSTITANGEVAELDPREGYGLVTCHLTLSNETPTITTEGRAVLAVPLRAGDTVPDDAIATAADHHGHEATQR